MNTAKAIAWLTTVIAVFFFAVGLFLLVMWLGLIVPPLLRGQPPQALASTTTLVIQALDLGIIVPVALLSGTLLLRRAPLGYLLASVVLVKTLTLGTAVSAMAVGELLAGVPLGLGELVGFPLLTLLGIGMALTLLRNISQVPSAPQADLCDGLVRDERAAVTRRRERAGTLQVEHPDLP